MARLLGKEEVGNAGNGSWTNSELIIQLEICLVRLGSVQIIEIIS